MQDDTQLEIAAAAARMIVEDGLEYGSAKRRALKVLGLPERYQLPSNDMLESAVREHIALFCADTQPRELRALRELALVWMERLTEFRPHLGAAAWNGTATRLSDIYIQLFCDDPKSAELRLIDQGVNYTAGEQTGLRGEPTPSLSFRSRCVSLGEMVSVHLLVYDHDHLRGALKPDAQGRKPRGDAAALKILLATEDSLLQ